MFTNSFHQILMSVRQATTCAMQMLHVITLMEVMTVNAHLALQEMAVVVQVSFLLIEIIFP